MPYYCTVPRCTSMAGKAKNVSFHQFPRDEEMAKLWNNILKRGKPYTKYSKVCSLHFRPEDYTMTSVGKNKGQWRTLRKDAIPSCNLPSDSPTPQYQRRSSTGVMAGPTIPPNLMDPQIQQQMAQAIYVQTMLAMQAASFRDVDQLGTTDQSGTIDLSVRHNESPEMEERLQNPPSMPSQSAYRDVSELEEILLNYNRPKDSNTLATDKTEKPTNLQESTSYKCFECTRCFKDPDVFLLHKRSHRNAENISNGSSVILQHQKENIDCNFERQENNLENLRQETLKANPILANLLRPDTVPDLATGVSVENQIMTAMALNMQAYIRSLAQKSNFTESDSDVSETCDELNESKDSNRLVIDESV